MPSCTKCGSTGVHSEGASCEFKFNKKHERICYDGEGCKLRVKAQKQAQKKKAKEQGQLRLTEVSA
jgi:hypothetical protein